MNVSRSTIKTVRHDMTYELTGTWTRVNVYTNVCKFSEIHNLQADLFIKYFLDNVLGQNYGNNYSNLL